MWFAQTIKLVFISFFLAHAAHVVPFISHGMYSLDRLGFIHKQIMWFLFFSLIKLAFVQSIHKQVAASCVVFIVVLWLSRIRVIFSHTSHVLSFLLGLAWLISFLRCQVHEQVTCTVFIYIFYDKLVFITPTPPPTHTHTGDVVSCDFVMWFLLISTQWHIITVKCIWI